MMDVRKGIDSDTSYANFLPFRQSLLKRGNSATLLATAYSLNKKAKVREHRTKQYVQSKSALSAGIITLGN